MSKSFHIESRTNNGNLHVRPQGDFDAKYDAKVKAANLFMIAGGVTALVYVANWVDALFFTKVKFGDKTALGGQGEGHFQFNVVCSPERGGERVYYGGTVMRF